MADFNPQKINQSPVVENTPPINKSFYQANKFYIWAVGFAVVVIAILAFFAFRPQAAPQIKEANVQVEILAPETLPSGGEAVYRLQMKNNDSVKLTGLELELAYPEGVAYVESSPKASNLSGSVFSVPDLLPGQNVTVIVKAKVSGDINSEKRLLAKLHYKYSNFNSSFVKESSHTLRLTASDITLEIEGPKEANSAQLVAYTITYKNNSKDALKNARVKLNYPAGFNYAASQPTASLGGNTWNIGDLQSGAEGKITAQGTFASSQAGESKTVEAQFLVLGQNGEYFVQSSAEVITSISSQPLLVSLENLDQQGESGIAPPGATLNFAVRYQNNASVAATGVNIVVTFDSKALDFSSLQAQGAQVVGSAITWNAAGVPNLEVLNPGEEGVLNFYVRVKNPATKDSSKNLSVKAASKIKASEYSTFLPGSGLEIKISSPAEIQAGLSFLSGSLPPKVGTQTKYKATLKLLNSSNDFSQGQLTVFLPSASGSFSLESVNAAERANVQFDPATGRLTWRVDSLPAHAGKFSPAKILEFTVAASPSPSDVGSSPVLLRNTRFSAKDDFTGQEINISAEDLTTASLSGQGGYENGIVVP